MKFYCGFKFVVPQFVHRLRIVERPRTKYPSFPDPGLDKANYWRHSLLVNGFGLPTYLIRFAVRRPTAFERLQRWYMGASVGNRLSWLVLSIVRILYNGGPRLFHLPNNVNIKQTQKSQPLTPKLLQRTWFWIEARMTPSYCTETSFVTAFTNKVNTS